MVGRAPWLPWGVCPPAPSGEEAGGPTPGAEPWAEFLPTPGTSCRGRGRLHGCTAGRRVDLSQQLPAPQTVLLLPHQGRSHLCPESQGRRTSSVQMGCVAGLERRPSALLLSGASGAGPPTSKEPIHPLNTEARRELTPYHFKHCPAARAQRPSYNQVASVHFITEGCGV